MTSSSRQVLQDCKIALSMLEDDMNSETWRVHWAAAVALSRAVGHILHKVDAVNDTRTQNIVNAKFKEWKSSAEEHQIFREFIEKERNNLLKEYRTDVHPHSSTGLEFEYTLKPFDGGPLKKFRNITVLDENIYRPMIEGPYEGGDARDVLQEAITWWENQLDEIDWLAATSEQ